MWCAIFLAVVTATQFIPTHAQLEKDARNICHLPKDVGPCEIEVLRYYYNSKVNRCLLFFYGGCSGNANNFYSRHSCEKTCLRTKDIKAMVNTKSKLPSTTPMTDAAATCQLPKDDGLCDTDILRYFYNSTENKCHIFTYRGCFGNANNFMTKLECEKTCLKPEKSDFSDYNVDSKLSFAVED
ncbi:BPTI/Kunitz domain-containing protein-like [Pyxicephalus adspersus]|uniref:BPTI/Kunitz domain-containing protein-like n=1 Tax=Pyxicephalus adspersus TaxID=30357 RepID=UPI003B5A840A